jgi:hypothetical protein
MNSLFDSAGLAIVAYAEVLADGTSPNTNSGVGTTKTGTGRYAILLPADKTQAASRDLIFVQALGVPNATPVTSKVEDTTPGVKYIEMTNGSTNADSAFSVLILRTIVPPPAGAPA